MVARRAHSLVELMVALVILGVALTALHAAALAGSRWMTEATQRQTAVRLAAQVADSLARGAPPGGGERVQDGIVIRWSVGGRRIEVRASDPSHRELARLRARIRPRLPAIPGPGPR